MSYRNKYGITKIMRKWNAGLDISWDANNLNGPKNRRHPILLFVSDYSDGTHYHIELNKTQAKKLHKWLTDYLKDCK